MSTGAKKRVSVCTVTYNSAKDVERFLRSCEDCLDGHSLEVIVVDNASSDGTVSLVEKLSPRLDKRVVAKGRNLFYTRAINEAMSLAGGEYILVINPDCHFDASMLDLLVAHLERDGETGICGPSFYYPDGRAQASGSSFPSRRAFLEHALGSNERFFSGGGGRASAAHEGVRYTDFIYGACFLIGRDFYNVVGKFDENFVHGWDEYDYGMRVAAAGKKCATVMAAKCFHSVGGSRPEGMNPALVEHYVSGLLHLSRKYYGRAFEMAMVCCMKAAAARRGAGDLPRKTRAAVYSAGHTAKIFLRKLLM
jgi:GT2 family glycosyltransferase